jgi:hypothetical protein
MWRCTGLALAVWLVSGSPASAQLSKVETDRVRVVYVAPTETYLVPHATRTLINADAFLRNLFDYKPDERVTALLLDFADYGNAGATSVPRDSIRVQIAPELAFEPSWPTAHERYPNPLVHVVSMDQATRGSGVPVVLRQKSCPWPSSRGHSVLL